MTARWILNRAASHPEAVALTSIHTKKEWTYQELCGEIGKWQQVFRECGLRQGDRLCVLSQNRPELFAVLFACGLSGILYVPLNYRLSQPELKSIIADCTPVFIVTDALNAETASAISDCPAMLLESVGAAGSAGEASEEVKADGDDPWTILYTGGTTGLPKGAVLSFANMNWNALNTIVSWSLTGQDVTVNYMPMFHTGGLNALSLPVLMAGGTVAVGDRFEPTEALQAVLDYRATVSLFVPTMHQLMTETPLFSEAVFHDPVLFLSGGAPCPAVIYDRYRGKGIPFKEGYGLTEAGPNNFSIPPETALKKRGAVGKSMQFNEVRVVLPDGTAAGTGEVGELQLRGPHIIQRYWNNENATAAAFRDGWLCTGDLARTDEEGDLYIVGRSKDMIISGGENIYPQEVEKCLMEFPGIKDAAVVGVPHERWGEAVTAFIIPVHGPPFDEKALIDHCRRRLGGYKVPKRFIPVTDFPKTHIGKVDKKQLALNGK
ncbi:AMP-binding protein [Indiicoccus explosivorum]|uniref:AMP-binding protein n=1 Tax=Indiicoccus explosivorum TaxID=1917864 RepID=UPI001F4E1589|nr:AMP-binding protein [Indiicoccus explosivorum]